MPGKDDMVMKCTTNNDGSDLPQRTPFTLRLLFDWSRDAEHLEQPPDVKQLISELLVELKAESGGTMPWTETQLTTVVLFCLGSNDQLLFMLPTLITIPEPVWPYFEIDFEKGACRLLPEGQEILGKIVNELDKWITEPRKCGEQQGE